MSLQVPSNRRLRSRARTVAARASSAVVCVLAAALAASCRSAAPGDLVDSVPDKQTSQSSNGPTDRATPGGGLPIPAGCVVDPGTVPEMEVVAVPAGPFVMGCNPEVDTQCRSDEYPKHTVTLDAFAIDKTEVTQAEWALCLQDGKCEKPYCPGWNPCTGPTLPIACVSYDMAAQYCAYKGKRMPTEAEWEKAARGDDGRKYPWGNTPPVDCAHANMSLPPTCGSATIPVGTTPEGASPYGALDMAGNLVEWVSDWYQDDYYASSAATNPQGPAAPAQGGSRGGRGGGWRSDDLWQRVSVRDLYEPDYVKDSLGFRCVK